jgi:cAMP-dependent protein kinase regulator
VVFSEPVALDTAWSPVVIPKSPAQAAEIERALAGTLLFSSLSPETLRIIVDAMSPREPACGEVVIRQGDAGDFYYVLLEGAADILVDGALVLAARAGSGFGELALLYDAPRAASVVVTSTAGARVAALDRATFKRVLIGATCAKRAAHERALAAVPILGDVRALGEEQQGETVG